MKTSLPRLPDAELEVMQAIWDSQPPISRADIQLILEQKHPLAATTILTLLSRLTERGALRMEKQGRGNIYTPVFTRQEYLASQSRAFMERLCNGDIRAFAAALCHSGLSREDIEELSRLLEAGEL